jgi:hypothetical protein
MDHAPWIDDNDRGKRDCFVSMRSEPDIVAAACFRYRFSDLCYHRKDGACVHPRRYILRSVRQLRNPGIVCATKHRPECLGAGEKSCAGNQSMPIPVSGIDDNNGVCMQPSVVSRRTALPNGLREQRCAGEKKYGDLRCAPKFRRRVFGKNRNTTE